MTPSHAANPLPLVSIKNIYDLTFTCGCIKVLRCDLDVSTKVRLLHVCGPIRTRVVSCLSDRKRDLGWYCAQRNEFFVIFFAQSLWVARLSQ